MNTASVKLVLNGAKQANALLKKYKQDQERKDFDAIDALRRSQLTDAERDELIANSPAHIRAVAEHMRKEEGAAKALEKARALALAYDEPGRHGVSSSEATVHEDHPYVDIAAAREAAAQEKDNRVNNKKKLKKQTNKLRKRALKATKSERKALKKNFKAGRDAVTGSTFAATAAKAFDEAKDRGTDVADTARTRGADFAEVAQTRGNDLLSTAKDYSNEALETAKERGAGVEKKVQERAAEARKRAKAAQKKARKQAKKNAKKNQKAFAKNKKQFAKDVDRRKAKAGKKADKILTQKGLKKQKKSNKLGVVVTVIALAAAVAAALKFLGGNKKPAPSASPKVQDFAPANTGAAAKSKAAEAARTEQTEVANTDEVAETFVAPGVEKSAEAPEAPAVHHAEGADAETKDAEATTEHGTDSEFPAAGDDQDPEGGKHRL